MQLCARRSLVSGQAHSVHFTQLALKMRAVVSIILLGAPFCPRSQLQDPAHVFRSRNAAVCRGVCHVSGDWGGEREGKQQGLFSLEETRLAWT